MPGPAPGPPDHGTRKRYQNRRWPCRCSECCSANTLFVQSWRVRVARSGTDRPLPLELA